VTTRAAQLAVRAKLGATLGIATVTAGTTAATAATTGTAATAGTTTATAAAGTVATAKSALAIKLAAVALTVGAGTAVTTVAVTRDREAARPAVSERAKPNPPAATSRSAIRVEPIEVPAPEPVIEEPPREPPPRTPIKRVEPPASVAVTSPASQSQLLADASRSLSQGNAARALELIEDDTRAHATGPLAEEREALRISTLVALERIADAQAAARELLATYPSSIHRRLAEQVLAKETP
jgi:hypothetical protein